MLINFLLILLVVLLLVIIAVLLAMFGLFSEVISEADSNLLKIEKAYQMSIKTGRIEYIYQYAKIPLALNIANNIRFNNKFAKNNSYENADVSFEELEPQGNILVYEKTVHFRKVRGELYTYGKDFSERWYLDKLDNKLVRIEVC